MEDSVIFKERYIPKVNVYHVHDWKITQDWENICKTNDINKINEFYNKFIRNINKEFKENSMHAQKDEQIQLLDYSGIKVCAVNIDYDIHERLINWSFRQIVPHSAISAEVIDWFNSLDIITENTYHLLFNTLCIIGDCNTAKLLYSKINIDFHMKIHTDSFTESSPWSGYIGYLRNAITRNHLDMAMWLYEMEAMPKEKELVDNIYELCMERSNSDMKEWVNSLDEYSKIPNILDTNFIHKISNIIEI